MNSHAKSSVMIVDDDPLQREMLSAYFRRENYKTIVGVEDGLAATSQLERFRGRLDLIVCDVNMPHLDGVEFLNHLRAIGFTGRFLYISGSINAVAKMADTLAQVSGLNYLGLIKKPLSAAALDHFLYGGGGALLMRG